MIHITTHLNTGSSGSIYKVSTKDSYLSSMCESNTLVLKLIPISQIDYIYKQLKILRCLRNPYIVYYCGNLLYTANYIKSSANNYTWSSKLNYKTLLIEKDLSVKYLTVQSNSLINESAGVGLLQEYFAGGSLKEYIISNEMIIHSKDIDISFIPNYSSYDEFRINTEIDFMETEIQLIIIDVLKGLKYLNSKQIAHRDLKSSNLYLDYRNGVVKINDFDTCVQSKHQTTLFHSIVGTPGWMAPEISSKISGQYETSSDYSINTQEFYDYSIDIWSIGIVILELIFKSSPMQSEKLKQTIQCITKQNYEKIVNYNSQTTHCNWYHERDSKLSQTLKNFVSLCLRNKSNQRPSIYTLLKHPFLTNKLDNTINIKNIFYRRLVCSTKSIDIPILTNKSNNDTCWLLNHEDLFCILPLEMNEQCIPLSIDKPDNMISNSNHYHSLFQAIIISSIDKIIHVFSQKCYDFKEIKTYFHMHNKYYIIKRTDSLSSLIFTDLNINLRQILSNIQKLFPLFAYLFLDLFLELINKSSKQITLEIPGIIQYYSNKQVVPLNLHYKPIEAKCQNLNFMPLYKGISHDTNNEVDPTSFLYNNFINGLY